MPGRGLLSAGGAAGARKNKMVKIAVTALAVVLLLTAAAVSTATDGRARLRAFLMMVCVVSQINLGRLLAREAALARTPAARRCYAVSAVACFVELALKLYMILVLCPAGVEDGIHCLGTPRAGGCGCRRVEG
ncbi:hypothetical protein CFC21_016300 [Triticum aestivum]|uniref:Uncharacterized protein n=2 Tax=Triticum aestivum TaxID=4565 RepID=A0A9R1J114_WHEAT|nr:uncharacterized protein LOC123185079 [Triticum aestivum]KAF7000380.1 hypothetical protein CFC21_016300 [Triticum aestivum]